jgi:hypothetical protein
VVAVSLQMSGKLSYLCKKTEAQLLARPLPVGAAPRTDEDFCPFCEFKIGAHHEAACTPPHSPAERCRFSSLLAVRVAVRPCAHCLCVLVAVRVACAGASRTASLFTADAPPMQPHRLGEKDLLALAYHGTWSNARRILEKYSQDVAAQHRDFHACKMDLTGLGIPGILKHVAVCAGVAQSASLLLLGGQLPMGIPRPDYGSLAGVFQALAEKIRNDFVTDNGQALLHATGTGNCIPPRLSIAERTRLTRLLSA